MRACLIAIILLAAGGIAQAQPDQIRPAVEASKSAMMSDPALALELAKSIETSFADDDAAVATAMWLQGEALARLNRPRDALSRLASIVSDDAKLMGDVELAKARAHLRLNDQVAALAAFQTAHVLLTEADDSRGQAMALMGIARLYRIARRYDRALDYFERASEAYRVQDAVALVMTNNRAGVLRDQDRLNEAADAFAENLDLATRLGDAYAVANTHLQLASIAIENDEPEAARRHWEAAVDSRSVDENTANAFATLIQARLAVLEGDTRTAEAVFSELFEGHDWSSPLSTSRSAYEAAASFYAEQERFELAYRNMNAFAEIEAQLNGAATANAFNLLNAEFEASARELEIERLNSARLQAEIIAANQAERMRTLVTAIFGLAVAGVLLTVLWHLRSAWRASHELAEANDGLRAANEAKTRFLANTSHEIRTPLNAILGMAEALLAPADDDELTPPRRQRIETIQRSGELLLAIVTDILDVSKMEQGKLDPVREPTALAPLVETVHGMHAANAEAKGLALETDVEGGLPHFVTDSRLVTQAIGNLVSNAIKFTDEGSVRVAVRRTPDGFEASVTDTGIGIPKDQCERVFDAFAQVEGGADRRFGGTGLGLAIVRDIAALLGGSVGVESTPGQGSTFTLSLPCEVAEPAAAPASAALASAADLSRLNVLLAEDNAVNVAVVRALIGNAVACLDVVMDGESAVERVRMTPYDVVLMDNQMPGMSGGDATRRIRAMAERRDIPIIGVTADIAPAVRRELEEAGMDMIVAKPVTRDALLKAIGEAVGPANRAVAAAG